MDLGLNNKRALVTGASKGLGKAVAQALRAEGAAVAICARDAGRIAAAANEIGATGIVGDLSVRGAAANIARQAIDRLGGVDILVVNTGGPPAGTFETTGDEAWRGAFENLWMSTVDLIRGCLPGMRERRFGRIMIVTSMTSREPLAKLMISNALRPGLHGLVNALSREVAGDGITVNAVMPGYTLTERLRDIGIDEKQIAAQIPAGRLGRPEEFAALAAFLASEQAGYICGQAIAVDGGYLHSI
ncbi:MAG: SDR family oxidoreductase [Hyphomicrobiales bacterium]|jgi:3-oxoacyl-[acyl-carrier protein] reductase|nr:SDR family oxidoreductase [Hyphomicrobiales bacterium]